MRYRADRLKALLAGDGAIDELEWPTVQRSGGRSATSRCCRKTAPLWRVSVPPAAGAPLLDALERELELAWLADWAGGLLWLASAMPTTAAPRVIRAALAAPGGHATLVRASAGLRAAVPVFQPQEPALARLSARVKASFDPKRILNPGRMYPEA